MAKQRISYVDPGNMDPETSASMAPGYETAQVLATSKAATDYWARKATGPKKSAA